MLLRIVPQVTTQVPNLKAGIDYIQDKKVQNEDATLFDVPKQKETGKGQAEHKPGHGGCQIQRYKSLAIAL